MEWFMRCSIRPTPTPTQCQLEYIKQKAKKSPAGQRNGKWEKAYDTGMVLSI